MATYHTPNIYPGYRGIANVGGNQFRFADANITAKQEVRLEDIVMGTWDYDAYVYGPVDISGSINGPATENFVTGGASSIWQWATKRQPPCGEMLENDVELWYYCGSAGNNYRKFSKLLVNTVGFSCAAGDIAQFTLDVMGYLPPTVWASSTPPLFTSVEKFITWDKVSITLTPGADGGFTSPPISMRWSNFDFTVANQLTPQYAIVPTGASPAPNLFPVDVVPGLRKLTGTMTCYNIPMSNGVDRWDDYLANNFGSITFNIASIALTFNCRFHRVEPASKVGPITSTIGFTGVGNQNW